GDEHGRAAGSARLHAALLGGPVARSVQPDAASQLRAGRALRRRDRARPVRPARCPRSAARPAHDRGAVHRSRLPAELRAAAAVVARPARHGRSSHASRHRLPSPRTPPAAPPARPPPACPPPAPLLPPPPPPPPPLLDPPAALLPASPGV